MANDKSYTIPKAAQSTPQPNLTMGKYLVDIRQSETFKKQLKLLLPELSAREAQVIFFYSFGLPITELCSFMKISYETAKTHIQHAKIKMGVTKTFEIRLVFFMRVSSYILVSDHFIPIYRGYTPPL